MCSSCETPFCKLCIERWKLLKNSCPSRCDSPLTLKPISRALKNLLDRVEIKCDKGCIVSLLNYKTHLLSCININEIEEVGEINEKEKENYKMVEVGPNEAENVQIDVIDYPDINSNEIDLLTY